MRLFYSLICVNYNAKNILRTELCSLKITRKVRLFSTSNVNHCTDKHELKVEQNLQNVFKLKETNVSSWIIESQVKELCSDYKHLNQNLKKTFLKTLASKYAVDHSAVCDISKTLLKNENECGIQVIRNEEKLRNVLNAQYNWLFVHIGKLEDGIKFLVDLRTDVLDLLKEADGNLNDSMLSNMQQLNIMLRDLLALWFSVGLLKIERITWKSPCEMLQKISDYEAVHPVRNWTDLKQRVGPYRRCFVYTHNSMPGEPLVVLHTALTDEIPKTVPEVMSNASRLSAVIENFKSPQDGYMKRTDLFNIQENSNKIKTAIFYSITSTQKGLQGIELGNYLIKHVIKEVVSEYPCISQFSSLSPIPNFKNWLFDKFKSVENGNIEILDLFTEKEVRELEGILCTESVCTELKKLLNSNAWLEMLELVQALEKPMVRLCGRYLYKEKRRGYALNSVANFHLRNGAVMWRINYLADLSPRGLTYSCGLMVNYRYFLDDTIKNSRAYIEQQYITISDLVKNVVDLK